MDIALWIRPKKTLKYEAFYSQDKEVILLTCWISFEKLIKSAVRISSSILTEDGKLEND